MGILSVDPGLSNGIAYFESSTFTYYTDVRKDIREVYDYFKEPLVQGLEQVVIENFAAQKISGYGLHTVRVVGAIEALCYIRNIPLAKQQPQQRLAFVAIAKRIVAKQPRIEDSHHHQADALAHLLAWQHKQGSIVLDNTHLYFKKDGLTIVEL